MTFSKRSWSLLQVTEDIYVFMYTVHANTIYNYNVNVQ